MHCDAVGAFAAPMGYTPLEDGGSMGCIPLEDGGQPEFHSPAFWDWIGDAMAEKAKAPEPDTSNNSATLNGQPFTIESLNVKQSQPKEIKFGGQTTFIMSGDPPQKIITGYVNSAWYNSNGTFLQTMTFSCNNKTSAFFDLTVFVQKSAEVDGPYKGFHRLTLISV